MDIPKLAEEAYKVYQNTLAIYNRSVPNWNVLAWQDQEPWFNVVQTVINQNLWERV